MLCVHLLSCACVCVCVMRGHMHTSGLFCPFVFTSVSLKWPLTPLPTLLENVRVCVCVCGRLRVRVIGFVCVSV